MLSMTGFGRGEAAAAGFKAVVEAGSVNRKQFDCHCSLPREFSILEAKLCDLARHRVSRGALRVSVQVAPAAGGDAGDAAVCAEIARIRRLAAQIGLRDDLTAKDLLRVEAAEAAVMPDPQEVWPAVEEAANAAFDGLVEMRAREGAALEKALRAFIAGLREIHGRLAARAPLVPAAYRDALSKRLAALLEGQPAALDQDALAREVALFADRADVREELARLDSHFAQAEKLMSSAEPCGRALDFLCQEFSREIGTLGAKANDAEMTRDVIRFKADLEAFREQVQNIE